MIIIEGTEETPYINFSNDKHEMLGRSLPDNAYEFYDPIIVYLTNFKGEKFYLDFKLDYFNTSSSKMINDMFVKIELMECDKCINWYYDKEDIDIFEMGQEYADLFDITFNFFTN